MIEHISNLINNLSLTFLAVSPTVFVFSVTLLGDAIGRSKQEEKAARENDKINIQKNIKEIEESLQKAKKDGDTTELTSRLAQLQNKQRETEKKIKDIKIKYTSIDFKNTVVYPGVAFLLSILISPFSASAYHIPFFSQVLLFLYGIIKIYRSLLLVQQISASKKTNEHYDQLKTALRTALEEYYRSTKEEVSIEFPNKAFPLNIATSTELPINFRAKLTKGSVLKNAYVWFFVADDLELVDPPETESWRQSADHNPPNIRTVKIGLGNLSVGPYIPQILKLKMPATPGKYLLRYAVKGEGYSGPSKDLTIIVL